MAVAAFFWVPWALRKANEFNSQSSLFFVGRRGFKLELYNAFVVLQYQESKGMLSTQIPQTEQRYLLDKWFCQMIVLTLLRR